jgi:hypothetical protein
MRIYHCDIWSIALRSDAVCITTNSIIKKDGHAVMGAGIALQAKQKYKNIDWYLALHIQTNGNTVGIIRPTGPRIISFPTKHHWKDNSDLQLIEQSAIQLARLIKEHGWTKVAMPKPGCANGKLNWTDVEPIIDKYLPSVFICEFKK